MAFQSKQPIIPLSGIVDADRASVPKKRREFLNTSNLSNQKLYAFANKALRKEVVSAVTEIEKEEIGNLSRKFFLLDHTAEVLENYRKIKENEIFQQILHDER
jgi:hypothetical protein